MVCSSQRFVPYPVSFSKPPGTLQCKPRFYNHTRYDETGQLTRAVLVSTDPDIPDQDLTYVYDAVGNRIRTIINGEVTEYTTNNMNQYVEVGDRTYVFDADGNLIHETGPDGTTTYTYNHENRLVAVTRGDDAWQYTYDALGNRIAVNENGDVTRYVIDPIGFGNVVGEYDAAGNPIAWYDHGYGLLSRVDASGIGAYYTFDALGNTRELTGPAGVVHNAYAYLPFGQTILHIATISNPFEFVGRWGVMTDGSGLNDMRARVYIPELGVFSAVDPIGLSGGDTNLYRYVLNDPLTYVDPQGQVLIISKPIIVPKPTPKLLPKPPTPKLLPKPPAQPAKPPTPPVVPKPPPLPKPKPKPQWPKPSPDGPGPDLPGEPTPSEPTPELPPQVPPGEQEDHEETNNQGSITPEDKFGPAGYDDPEVQSGDEERFILPGRVMHYRIDFWNDEDALVPTQDAVIFDWLDPAVFDVSTFEFTRIGFLDWDMPLPGTQAIDVRIDARPEMNIAVEVRAGWEMNVERPDGQMVLDDPTGKLVWWFHTVDPETGDYPDDPMAGFLPPFNPETEYELGWVEFRVKAWDDLPSGTRIENQAFVQFDFMPNPETGVEWGPALAR